MGDHRVLLNIKAEFHGKTYEIKNAWWNYDGHEGVDRRVIEFFENMWADGYGRYMDKAYASQEEQRKVAEEKAEREEYERLKAKWASLNR